MSFPSCSRPQGRCPQSEFTNLWSPSPPRRLSREHPARMLWDVDTWMGKVIWSRHLVPVTNLVEEASLPTSTLSSSCSLVASSPRRCRTSCSPQPSHVSLCLVLATSYPSHRPRRMGSCRRCRRSSCRRRRSSRRPWPQGR